MGQPIDVVGVTRIDDVAMFDTDRSITGQDGVGYASSEEAQGDDVFPARLAQRLLEGDERIDHVFVASNQVVVRRPGGWDDATVEAASRIITDFFLYYR